MILLLDNYDSFTWNVFHYLGDLGVSVEVVRNDAMAVDEAMGLKPEAVVVSPGPCDPDQAGISMALVEKAAECVPVLGICLGHQSIGQVFGGRVIRAPQMMHGKISPIQHNGQGVFAGLPHSFNATRYHSLIVERDSLPDCLEITAWTDDGLIMGVQHKSLPVHGVQFHPESIETKAGHDLLRNFLKCIPSYQQAA